MSMRALLLFVLAGTAPAASQRILVDHTSVPLFEHIPPAYVEAAKNLRLLFMDRSVGGNISDALTCLSYPHASAPSACRRYQHRDSAYAVSPSEVSWEGVWDRGNWRYEYWPANCSEDATCFIDAVEPRIDSFDVVGFQFSYLAVMPGSNLIHPVDGFFGTRNGRNSASAYGAFASRHPGKTVIWWTTSLARAIGSAESQAFNDAMRAYAATNGLVLFDVADILSHDPSGAPCYDNRDGVAYLDENHPDDGLDIPAICPQYTTETEGGHLGSISAGGIRVAKAFWVLMARIAGWDGRADTTGLPPGRVVLLSPPDGARVDPDSATLRWARPPGAVTRFHLQVAADSAFRSIALNDSNMVDSVRVLAHPQQSQRLFWQVRAGNVIGWGAFGGPWSFVADTARPFSAVPLTELGTGTYAGFPGGLYPGGRNDRPSAHDAAGRALAASIVPLDTLGIPDPRDGKIVLLSIGMSNATQEYSAFQALADTFRLRNPRCVVVDGAQGGQTASIIRNPDAQFWDVIRRQRLPARNAAAAQVQAVWIKEANAGPTQAFPLHAEMLRDDLAAVARLLPGLFPNIKVAYLSSRTYGGYATTALNPEPYAYESGFSVQWLIGEQIAGDTSLAFEGAGRRAPWLAWGPYLWADGRNPRGGDGLFWTPADFGADGTHPSTQGRAKVARLLLDFFSSDATAAPWFLAPTTDASGGGVPPVLSLDAAPNPSDGSFVLSYAHPRDGRVTVEVFDIRGIRVAVPVDGWSAAGAHTLAVGRTGAVLHPGVYLLRLLVPQGAAMRMLLVY